MRAAQLAAMLVMMACGDPTKDPDLHREVACDL
jgi:hypothetical protein